MCGAYPRISRLLAGARAPLRLGEGRDPSPSFGLLLVVVIGVCSSLFYLYFLGVRLLRFSDLRSPPSHNPHPHFHTFACGVAFALEHYHFGLRRRSFQPRHSGNARGLIQCTLDPSLPFACTGTLPKIQKKRKLYFFVSYSFSSFSDLFYLSFFFQSF